MSLERHIMLESDTALPLDQMRTWYQTVKKHAPNGLLMSTTETDDQGMPRSVVMVHREHAGRHSYLIPLLRDLLDDECEPIVDALLKALPDIDFEVSTSNKRHVAPEHHNIDVDQENYLALCTELAKKRHEDWVRERTNAGWQYGTSFNARNKTHPNIRPWDQLPDQHRHIDLTVPQHVIDMLDGHGYSVVNKEKLDRLLKR
jgi:hypothetical protein